MANGHLLAAPDRIVTNLEPILKSHGISCEHEYVKECDHQTYIIDLTSLICRNGKTQIGMGIEKRRGNRGVDIVLIPESRTFFRRDLESEALAEKIVEILCENGATDRPHARSEDIE